MVMYILFSFIFFFSFFERKLVSVLVGLYYILVKIVLLLRESPKCHICNLQTYFRKGYCCDYFYHHFDSQKK